MTITSYGEEPNVKTLEIYGLSTETKPIGDIDGVVLKDGSKFIEINTSSVYLYSEATKRWYEL